ncbi:MAG: N-acetyltransferase [Chloroflexota bacterium]|nr:N-acetyltransferase [Chloroflexota bacterium]
MEKIDKSKITDAEALHQLINHRFTNRDDVLPRALSEICEDIRDFCVYHKENQVIACAALHIVWTDLAEIRSVVVAEGNRHQGIGSALVQSCIDEGRRLGIASVFCLTHKPEFFHKMGFSITDKANLPQKVWTDCFHCPRYPECDAVALIRHI